MSRLIELLKEETTVIQQSQDNTYAKIDGAQYRYHSDAGNLFRLMLVTSPDQAFPQAGTQNLVSKMLPELLDEKPKDVKTLQTTFNKIKKITKKGKKPTVAIKKQYFAALFSLLLPLTSSASFKPSTLANKFASGSDSNVSFQRKATVLIGKALINSEKIDLESKDEMLIRGFSMGMEEMLDDEAPEKDVVTSAVTETTPTEELEQIAKQSEEVVENINKMNVDKTDDISTLLKTNESPEAFNVALTDNDEAAGEIVNSKIKETYNKTKKEHGTQVANFTAKLASDAFKQLNSINGYINAFKDQIKVNVEKTENGFTSEIVVSEDSGDNTERFKWEQTFTTNSAGETEVHLDEIQMPQSLQSKGLNKKFFKTNLDTFKAQGVDKISLEANQDVGGYAWFRYGFTPVDTKQIDGIARWMVAIAPKLVSAIQYDSQDLADYIENKTNDKSEGVTNLVSLIRSGDHVTAGPILFKFIENCSSEFKKTFGEKSDFKELGQKIANMNFNSTVEGKKYAISYKALLSIQALSDESGYRVIPLDNYLNWSGELSMKDLDDTYAYLNLK